MLDVFGDYSARDPFTALARAARSCPYQEAAENGGLYALGAEDVRRLLLSRDVWSERSSDQRLAAMDEKDAARRAALKRFLAYWPVFSDAAYHDRVRRVTVRLLRGTVTPGTLSACARLADRRLTTKGDDPVDWLRDVARPMALEAIVALVGRADAARLVRLGEAVMDELATARIDMARIDQALAAVDELRAWLDVARAEPPTPLVARLGELWSDSAYGPETATALLTQIVTGAYDPTTTSLCVVGERVDSDVLARVPVPSVREEVFRIATPFRFASRYARRPLSVGPYRLDVGDRVNLCLATANLDPAQFPEPLRIRDRGNTSRGLSFGVGKHYCPGAPLARAVVEVLLESMRKAGVHFRAEQVEREPELPMLRYRRLTGRLVPAAWPDR
ncbi:MULTISPECIES: cytochrome P450 [unclassified Streptomyces]|uniref:cytochrome P450 n=1 Tax=unclassified Streptomyces TaxID=2593676 RepID=UPI0022B63088|nr:MULTISPECIES: cytochrome P450 [unclassified Streptomyces]MCZ7415709.1 cytochrome P450 [Streptomyces sp. WMMC897]MCZ7434480.1 cytochrome P450 [Streptomyces sp. WMMC1477]